MMSLETSVSYPSWKVAPKRVLFVTLLASLSLSACSIRSLGERATPIIDRFTGQTIDAVPDANGIVTQGNTRYVVANTFDNMASMAARAGVSATELANHNGLPETYTPREGEALAIPPAKPKPLPQALPQQGIGLSDLDQEDLTPKTHTVIAGETIFEVARLYNVSVPELAAQNNLGSDLTIRPGQVLLLPSKKVALNDLSLPSDTATDADPDPAVDEPEVDTPAPTQTASLGNSGTFNRPVSGSVSQGFNPAADQDGYVYSTASKAPVSAVGEGKVVLVNESTGDSGTVVMIQHPNGLISIYGQMSDLKVSKGDSVSKGQSIGSTEAGELMFQLRRGTAPVDPKDYL